MPARTLTLPMGARLRTPGGYGAHEQIWGAVAPRASGEVSVAGMHRRSGTAGPPAGPGLALPPLPAMLDSQLIGCGRLPSGEGRGRPADGKGDRLSDRRDRKLGRRHRGAAGIFSRPAGDHRARLRRRHPSGPRSCQRAGRHPRPFHADEGAAGATATPSRPTTSMSHLPRASSRSPQGRLQLADVGPVRRVRNPIDIFLASLAEDRRERAVGIILSGAGSDGTLGIKAIKEQGGLTIAQGSDHSAPRHQGMPASAIASGLVDLELSVEAMPASSRHYASGLADVRSRRPGGGAAGGERGLRDPARARPARFQRLQGATFLRRVRRRMQVLQIEDSPPMSSGCARMPTRSARCSATC